MRMGQDIFPTALFGWAHSDIMAYPQPHLKGVGRWVEKHRHPSMRMGWDIFPTALFGWAHSNIRGYTQPHRKAVGPWVDKQLPPSLQMGWDILPTTLFGWAHSDIMAYPQPHLQGVGRWVEQTDTPFNVNGLGYIPHRITQMGPFRYNGIPTALHQRSGPMGGTNRYPLQCECTRIYSPLHYSGGPIQISGDTHSPAEKEWAHGWKQQILSGDCLLSVTYIAGTRDTQ
jgi:hypothetical protein